MGVSCDKLAEELGALIVGDGSVEVDHVAPLHRAKNGAISFVTDKRYLNELKTCAASAVLLTVDMSSHYSGVSIVSDNPYLDYARVTRILHPHSPETFGVHAHAVVSTNASIGLNVSIAAGVTIDDGVAIGDQVFIGPGCRIGKNVRIGSSSRLKANVVVESDCKIGESCLIQAGVVIGSDGFGYAKDGDSWVHIPQIGAVRIGNNVEIGANTTIDRGALDDTVIEDGVMLDNQIQIAHNVVVGENTAIAGCVGVAGSARIGKRCTIGGATTILGHLEIVDDVHVNAMSLVSSSILRSGSYSSATPVDEVGVWRKNFARFRKLDELARNVNKLDKLLAKKK